MAAYAAFKIHQAACESVRRVILEQGVVKGFELDGGLSRFRWLQLTCPGAGGLRFGGVGAGRDLDGMLAQISMAER